MFPPNPDPGDQFTLPDGRTFEWDGTRWVLVSGGGGGPLNDPTTTLGDLIVRGASAITRLGVGANDTVLTADSTAALGVAWKTGAATPSYTHVETTADDEWVIPHNLGTQYVAVQLVSNTGHTMLADIDFVSATRCDVHFAIDVAGTAIVRK